MNAARVESSERLQRVLVFLRERGEAGATTLELVVGANVCAVNSAIDELRDARNGFDIACERDGMRWRYRLVREPGRVA